MNEIEVFYDGEIRCWNRATFDKFSENNFLEKSSFLRCSSSKTSTDIKIIPLHVQLCLSLWWVCRVLGELDVKKW